MRAAQYIDGSTQPSPGLYKAPLKSFTFKRGNNLTVSSGVKI